MARNDQTYVVGLRKIRAVMSGMNQQHMDDLVMLIALADWGAKQVTIHGKTDGHHLQKPALAPGKYMVTSKELMNRTSAKALLPALGDSCSRRSWPKAGKICHQREHGRPLGKRV